MKINFTKNEYRILIEMLSIADRVVHSYSFGEEAISRKHNELRNKVFSYFKEFDAGDLIESGNEPDHFYEKDEYLERVHKNFMDPFEENFFWDELTHRLAVRDVINKIGKENYANLDMLERARKVEKAKESYYKEFDQNDLKNVIINKLSSIVSLSTEE